MGNKIRAVKSKALAKKLKRNKCYILNETDKFWDVFEPVDKKSELFGEGFMSVVIRVKKINGDGTVFAAKLLKKHAYHTILNEI